MHEYVQQTARRAQANQKEKLLFNSIPVFIKDSLPEELDIDAVLMGIENALPREFLDNVDAVYVGDFDAFREKAINLFQNFEVKTQ